MADTAPCSTLAYFSRTWENQHLPQGRDGLFLMGHPAQFQESLGVGAGCHLVSQGAVTWEKSEELTLFSQ